MTQSSWYRRKMGLRAAIGESPLRLFEAVRWWVTRRPWHVIAIWLGLAAAVFAFAPNLSELAAEGQAKLLPHDIESVVAGEWVAKAWPEQAYISLVAIAIERSSGLTSDDHAYAERIADRLAEPPAIACVARVLGPRSRREVAERLKSRDGTIELVLVELDSALVSPITRRTVAALRARVDEAGLRRPAGLDVFWSGDAVIGGDYMLNVAKSLDRAALATVLLLLFVLLFVYRSIWLALAPLATIGVGLVIARGAVAWLAVAGWDVSPLVELFLVAVLFGSGTDFCLFISWRYAEHFNPVNPAGAMRLTLRRAILALLSSAGTVIISLSLMGFNKFKLFSTTGPSVALGLLITLAATLTLTPAFLVLIGRYRPRVFEGFASASHTVFWDGIAKVVLARPGLFWVGTICVMAPLAILGRNATFLQDLFAELPSTTPSLVNLKRISAKFEPGSLAPLTVVLRSDRDLRDSAGLALIDDVSRLLEHQRSIASVRSATQPLGSRAPLDAARLSARIETVRDGFRKMIEGATRLQVGLSEGAAKIKALLVIEQITGRSLLGGGSAGRGSVSEKSGGGETSVGDRTAIKSGLASGIRQATGALLLGSAPSALLGLSALAQGETISLNQKDPLKADKNDGDKPVDVKDRSKADATKGEKSNGERSKPEDPRDRMSEQLVAAAAGAGQIVEGATRAERELTLILNDKVGRHALDRLLIRPDTVREHPELLESFAAYISSDGKTARIDLAQEDRIFSTAAINQVERLRTRVNEYLIDDDELSVRAYLTGPNAGAADVERLTESDQRRAWIVVPVAVLVVLFLALRDLGACVNLVGTMVLTYVFTLGVTHIVFVNLLGAYGLDWKVPYFLFVLLVAVGVDYNVFLMTRLQEETELLGLKGGTRQAIARTGGLISSAAAITACSFAAFLFSPLSSLRQLGFALVVGIAIDATLVRPILVPCGHWLLNRRLEHRRAVRPPESVPVSEFIHAKT